MASERQIAANRRNAKKSTGPRSKSGRQRTSRNAYRHGLAARPILNAVATKQVEELTRKILGSNRDALTREFARSAAEATLDLARVRRMKIPLFERFAGEPIRNARELPSPGREAQPAVNAAVQQQASALGDQVLLSAGTRSHYKRDQKSDAIFQTLAELHVLERYERRISSRRDRAIRLIGKRR